ncbi:MAG: hypothetical protein IT374_02290 [Polyangiaceae bacterium]|nr:hypothetical protein [Polyangiaceae bacterium]
MSRGRFWLAAALLWCVHLGVMLYMSPPSVILGPAPLISFDWSTHYEQCKRAVESFTASGRGWMWDPQLLAGQPSGAIFDADNKGFELWCLALVKLGVPFDRAFNLFIWAALGAVFPCVLLGARLLGQRPRAALVGAALACCVWWFDGFSHWLWFVGMISWGVVSYAWLVPLGLFVAYLRDRRPWQVLVLGPALAAAHTVHPYVFFVLAPPMLTAYVRARASLSRREHALVWGAAAVTVLANAWWLRVAFRFWHYILDSGYYLDARPTFLLWDWLAITKEPWVTGVVANLTSFRFVALGAGAVALVLARRARDARLVWLAVATGVPLFIAYVGGVTPLLRQVQPYRFILPLVMLAAVLAGGAIDELCGPVWQAVRERGAPGLALLASSLLGAPRLARDVQYFVPQLVPTHDKPLPLPPPNVSGPLELGLPGWPKPFDFRHTPDDKAPLLERFITAHDDGRSRWLLEWWMSGEQAAGRTRAQVLGGFREINLAHSDANFFRVHEDGKPIDPEAFRRYAEAFNVGWVGLVLPYPSVEERRDLLEPVVGPPGARWYRVRLAPSWIVGGGPGVVTAVADRITVRGSAGGSLVLKYHYLETLRCRPGCTLRRVPSPLTRVGFIGVDGAPADFEIYNP